MKPLPAIIYVIVGVCVAEAVVWCVLLPWMHYQYTTGIATDQLWKPVFCLAVIGGLLGLGAFAARSALKGR